MYFPKYMMYRYSLARLFPADSKFLKLIKE